MPYVMPVLLGFFDRTAASLGKVQLTERLDMQLAERLLAAAGEHRDGFVYVGRETEKGSLLITVRLASSPATEGAAPPQRRNQ